MRNDQIGGFDEIVRLLAQIDSHAKQLEVHGFPEANDRDLYGSRSQIIPRILAIRQGGGVGYELDSTMGIMNAIKQAQTNNRKFHTFYLIAINVCQRQEASNPPAWYQAWVDEIKASIEAGEKTYPHDRSPSPAIRTHTVGLRETNWSNGSELIQLPRKISLEMQAGRSTTIQTRPAKMNRVKRIAIFESTTHQPQFRA